MRNRPAVINRKKFMNGDPISECFAATQSEAIARTQKHIYVDLLFRLGVLGR